MNEEHRHGPRSEGWARPAAGARNGVPPVAAPWGLAAPATVAPGSAQDSGLAVAVARAAVGAAGRSRAVGLGGGRLHADAAELGQLVGHLREAHRHGPGHRRARRGDVRAAILDLLAEGRSWNGYQIIQEIAERTSGVWRPSAGSVYPALQQLEDEGSDHPRGRGQAPPLHAHR